MARVQKVPTICDRLIEACRYEYKTRHLIDGRIVQCDHRISVVAGYLTTEVSGLSPFTFMHKDDVRWVIVALRQSKFPSINAIHRSTPKTQPSIFNYSVRLQSKLWRILLPANDPDGRLCLPEDPRLPGG